MTTTRTSFLVTAAATLGLFASAANGQITNSAHDFSTFAWSGGEICKPCHTPHFSKPEDVGAPLWNHELTSANYTLHDGATGTAEADFDARSRLCLSCHDGTVALDSFGGVTAGTNFIPGRALMGTDLSNDHPIGSGAVYPTTASTRFNPQDAAHKVIFNGKSLTLRQWFDTGGAERFVVGCTTCHTVHNNGNFGHLLRFSNAGSQLCLTCHIK